MTHRITLELPEDTVRRFQQGATAARKCLEEFLAERLTEAVPPVADDLPSPFQEALKTLERLDDNALWTVARSQLPPAQQRRYRQLLAKHSQATITADEKAFLQTLGEEARLLTLKKAHAYMLLKWRGHHLPSPDASHRHG